MEVIGNDSHSSNVSANCVSDISSTSVVHMLQQLLDSSSFNETKIKGMVALLKRAKDDVAPFEDFDQILLQNNPLSQCLEESAAAPADIDGIIKRAESLLDVLADQALETKFNGETVDWFRFWEAFRSEIHSREDVPLALKFACLKQRLEGWPLNMLEKLGSGDSVYNAAMKDLQTAFSNKKVLVESHLNALLNLDPATPTPISLMRFSSEFEYHIRALEAYGASIEEASCMVAPVLNKKIPKQIWNRFNKADRTSYWNLLDFQNALKFEIELLNFESSQQVNNHSAVETLNISAATVVDECVYKNEAESVEGFQDFSKYSLKCQLCSGCHHFSGCTFYKTSFEKMERSQQLELCLMCVKRDHTTEKCLKSICCTLCRGKHNTRLCKHSLICLLCSGHHSLDDCNLYRTPAEKLKRTEQLGFCLLCFNADHATEKCLKSGCEFCSGKHNSLLCSSVTSKVKSEKTKVEKIIICQLCLGFHVITGCTTYKTPLEKIERVKELELCLLCIKDEHLTENCLKKDGCKICKEKHNTMLCVSANKVCPLCLEFHDISSCTVYKTPLEKLERAKEHQLCLLCMKDEHLTENCLDKGGCKSCKEKHNTLLCVSPNLRVCNTNRKTRLCVFCSGSHYISDCSAYRTPAERMERSKELKLCLLCLTDCHLTEKCQTQRPCKFCKEMHITLLCVKKKKKVKVCSLCSGPHRGNKCSTYKGPEKKMERAKELKLCLLCIRSKHPTFACSKLRWCKFCKEKHNKSLCVSRNSNIYKKIKTWNSLCPLCSEYHDICGCTTYKTPLEKLERAKVLNLCLLCIKADHATEKCIKTNWCKDCNGKHNTLICNQPSDKCSLQCGSNHQFSGCLKYNTPFNRHERAVILNLCLLCLESSHSTSKCLSEKYCKNCKEKHNTYICIQTRKHRKKKANSFTCTLCSNNHHGFGCSEYKTAFERRSRAVHLNLCLVCVSNKHVTSECLKMVVCKFCHAKHHSLLCIDTKAKIKRRKELGH